MKNVPVATTIDPELNEKLEEYAREENRLKSQVLRMALTNFVEAERNKPLSAFTLVDVIAFINQMQREHTDGKIAEDIELLSEKMAALIAAERG